MAGEDTGYYAVIFFIALLAIGIFISMMTSNTNFMSGATDIVKAIVLGQAK